MTMIDWNHVWVSEAKLQPGIGVQDLLISLPDLPDTLKMVEQTEDGNSFFCISSIVDPMTQKQNDWQPERLALAWDASGSRTEIDRDLQLLEMLFTRLQTCTVDVVVFRNQPAKQISTFTLKKGDSTKLTAFLRSLPCDGATNLSALDLSTGPVTKIDAWLLFSDGLDTVYQSLPVYAEIPVIPVVSQTIRNRALLDYLAEETGGTVIDLNRIEIERACDTLCFPEVKPKVNTKVGCHDVHVVQHNNRLLVSGAIDSEHAEVQIKLADAAVRNFQISRQDSGVGEILAR